MSDGPRYPTATKLQTDILAQMVALDVLDCYDVATATAALQYKLRQNVILHYALYGKDWLCAFANDIQLREPGCRQLRWLKQENTLSLPFTTLELAFKPKGGKPA